MSDWGEHWSFDIATMNGVPDFQRDIIVQHPEHIKIWWPHGIGFDNPAHLRLFKLSLNINGAVSNETSIEVGIRTVYTYLDTHLQAQQFRINHEEIYLVGGNWITTDQALRYSASKERYCNEIALHRHAGLNLIRVWGQVASHITPKERSRKYCQ
jgi:mannosylglycoprotein endo-beta-mannosidase